MSPSKRSCVYEASDSVCLLSKCTCLSPGTTTMVCRQTENIRASPSCSQLYGWRPWRMNGSVRAAHTFLMSQRFPAERDAIMHIVSCQYHTYHTRLVWFSECIRSTQPLLKGLARPSPVSGYRFHTLLSTVESRRIDGCQEHRQRGRN